MSDSLVTPWTLAYQALPSMGFPRQEYCSGVPLPSPKPIVHMHIKVIFIISSNYFVYIYDAVMKEMATHSSILAWRIPGTGEPGGLPSMRSHRVRHD